MKEGKLRGLQFLASIDLPPPYNNGEYLKDRPSRRCCCKFHASVAEPRVGIIEAFLGRRGHNPIRFWSGSLSHQQQWPFLGSRRPRIVCETFGYAAHSTLKSCNWALAVAYSPSTSSRASPNCAKPRNVTGWAPCVFRDRRVAADGGAMARNWAFSPTSGRASKSERARRPGQKLPRRSMANRCDPIRCAASSRTYLLDVLPATIARRGRDGAEELTIRTNLTRSPELLRTYTTQTPDAIRALAASDDPDARAALINFYPPSKSRRRFSS